MWLSKRLDYESFVSLLNNRFLKIVVILELQANKYFRRQNDELDLRGTFFTHSQAGWRVQNFSEVTIIYVRTQRMPRHVTLKPL